MHERLESRAVAAALTLLLHAAILWGVVHRTTRTVSLPPPPAFEAPTAERLHAVTDHVVSVAIVRPDATTSGLACAGSSYVGIGVTADPRTDRIILVGDDTPASRAGLKRDDIVLNPDVWRDAHPEGTLLQLLVLRDSEKLVVTLRVGTICIG